MKPNYRACPHCGAVGCCRPHGKYKRWVIYICSGIRTERLVFVKRVKCSACKRTHALLADVLIPYCPFSLRFILHVLRAYINRCCSVEALCKRFAIATATLYKWKDLFMEHANLWLSALKRAPQLSIQALDFFESIDKLPSAFFQRYGFSFLQSLKTTRYSRSP